MKLSVITSGGTKFPLDVEAADTLGSVFKKINQSASTPRTSASGDCATNAIAILDTTSYSSNNATMVGARGSTQTGSTRPWPSNPCVYTACGCLTIRV